MRVLVFIFFVLNSMLNAQSFQVGLLGGMTLLNGDYPSARFKDTLTILVNPGFGAFIRKPISDQLAIKGSVYLTRFRGDDRLIPRFIGIHNPSSINRANTELQINAEYIPFRLPAGNSAIEVFFQSGIVFSKTTASGSDINDDCPIINLGIPIGAGLRLPIKDKYSVFGQFEYVQGLNDCFDGYIDLAKVKDVYYSFKIGFSTVITPQLSVGKNIGCPKF